MVANRCLDCWKGIYLGTSAFLVNELTFLLFWGMEELVYKTLVFF